MLLDERWPEIAATATILATDISEPAVNRAREGIYSSLEVNRGLGAARLVRHFDQVKGGFQLKQKLRDRIVWREGNLLGPSREQSSFDVVMCRNVLIYFSDPDRQVVLSRLDDECRPGGYIALGSTEHCAKASLGSGWYAN